MAATAPSHTHTAADTDQARNEDAAALLRAVLGADFVAALHHTHLGGHPADVPL